MRRIATILALPLLVQPAGIALAQQAGGQASGQASAQASAQGDVSVTIYNNDLALVQDVRQLGLTKGLVRQEFPDVSANIRPETVTLNVADAGIVEQNFDYDLLSPDKLMDKAVGQTVTLVHTNPATGAETREQATVLANNGGTIVRVGERIEVLEGSGARVVFPSLPANLRARPTLSVTLDSTRGGTRPATLSYLSRGFSWKADYVALFDESAGKIDVQGWVTLNNTSGTTFERAGVLLVAGAVGKGSDDGQSDYQPSPMVRAGAQSAPRETLGDFYLYPIKGRTTLANAQQKQVGFLDVHGASAAKVYQFRNAGFEGSDDPQSAASVLRFSTARDAGLGDALPAGTVRVYMKDARGQPQFIGENAIGHTPMGSDLALKTGDAFDVKVKPTVEKRERISSSEWERTGRWRITTNGKTEDVTVERQREFWRTTMTYKVTNARPQAVTVDVVQAGLDTWWHDARVPSESLPGKQRSLDERVWQVPVPVNGETVLTVQFDTRY
ncbi:DUF4139 domain-containing protein [Novosphingobium sp.]|uniref:DUF4139 domain-containing protein n=1 Tax=Novosphingobium sp. TaxID=1874826 RepID=UPI0038B87D80